MPKKPSILISPKVTYEKLGLGYFDPAIEEEEIGDSRVRRIWNAYDRNFDSLPRKDRKLVSTLVRDILGSDWRVAGRGGFARFDYGLGVNLKKYYSLLEKRPYLRSILSSSED